MHSQCHPLGAGSVPSVSASRAKLGYRYSMLSMEDLAHLWNWHTRFVYLHSAPTKYPRTHCLPANMSSAINPFPALRTCAFRPPRPSPVLLRPVIGVKRPACRTYADEKNSAGNLPKSSDDVGPNMQQQEHVSEEAAKTAQIMGKEGPDIEGQGTPVEEVSGRILECARRL